MQSPSSQAGSSASSLSLLQHADTTHKIRDMLPGDTAQRTELLLSLLKTSYTSSLHNSDLRLASLTQELVSLRAQHSYVESKLRAAEALAEEAGRAVEEQRKRADQLMQENVRLKADNQALKAENQQLANFKTILMSAANGIGTQQQQQQQQHMQPLLPQPLLQMGLTTQQQQQQQQQQQSHLPQSYVTPSLSTADLDHLNSPHQQRHSSAAAAPPAHFFSPIKSRGVHESIALTTITPLPPHRQSQSQQQQQQSAQQQQHHPYPQTPISNYLKPPGSYVHVMPSPLSADALSSPMPASVARSSPSPVAAASNDILQEINAHLGNTGRPSVAYSASPSPSMLHGSTTTAAAATMMAAMNGYSHQYTASSLTPSPFHSSSSSSVARGSMAGTTAAPSSSLSMNLADQARSLFQTAQARLPAHVFSEFVALVQQFRNTNASSSSSNAHSPSTIWTSYHGQDQREAQWEAIRQRAAHMLAGNYQDIHALFEQLLQATQMQQQR